MLLIVPYAVDTARPRIESMHDLAATYNKCPFLILPPWRMISLVSRVRDWCGIVAI